MSKQQASKRQTYVCGPGTLIYPHLNKARDYQENGKFAYTTGIRLDEAQFDAVRHVLETDGVKLATEKYGKRFVNARGEHKAWKSDPFRTWELREELRDAAKPTELAEFEYVSFKANTPRKIGDKEIDARPLIFDAQLKPIAAAELPFIGAGTIARISYQIYVWDTHGVGISLTPVAIQILKLVEYVPRQYDGVSLGFEAEDEGYAHSVEGAPRDTATPLGLRPSPLTPDEFLAIAADEF